MAQKHDDWRFEPRDDDEQQWLPATLLQIAIEVGLVAVLAALAVYVWLTALA